MSILRNIPACLGLACVGTSVLAGFNEGDSIGPSGLEFLFFAAIGLIALPIGALFTFTGLERLFTALLWLLGFCLLGLAIAGIAFAGQFAVLLVIIVAGLAVPAAAFYWIGGLLGRAARRRKTAEAL
ncbi:MAG: hypothetical protein AAFP16_06930 [Pseudomonadota bacterium]